MGDAPGNENPSKEGTTDAEVNEVKIEIERPEVVKAFWQPQQPPPRYPQQPPQQNYYYNDPSYDQRQTPAYQQQVGGQNIYVAGGYPSQPVNVSRGQPAHRYNDPNQPEEHNFWRNSEIFTDAFNTVAIRNRFVQRVFTILSVQLFVSFGFILLCTFERNVRLFFIINAFPIMIVSMIVFFITSIALVCCVDLRRYFPVNFIMLAILTVAMTLLMCTMVAFSSPIVVLAAIGTTAAVCTLVSLIACQTKFDVTGCGMCLCIGTLVLMLFGVIIMILGLCGVNIKLLHIIYSAIATVLFCFWLMYDVQQIVGGRRIELSPEEYIFGALSLYIDIMYIFMHLLVLYQYCLGD